MCVVSEEGLPYVCGQWGRFTICVWSVGKVYHMLGSVRKVYHM